MPEIDIAPVSTPDAGLTSTLTNSDNSNTLPDTAPLNVDNNSSTSTKKLTEDEIFAQPSKTQVDKVKTPPLDIKEVVDPHQAQTQVKVDEPITPEAQAELDKKENDELELIVEEDLSVAKINQFVKDIPELQAAFSKNPAVRNAVFAMARRSSKLGEYQSIIPTPEAAKFAAENSQNFIQMNELFFSDDPNENVSFWDTLYTNSLQKDPVSGEPVKDGNGNFIPTGAYERITGAYRKAVWSELNTMASKLPDDKKSELINALGVIKEYAGDGKRQPKEGEVTNEAQLTPEQQRKLSDAEQVISQRTKEQETQRVEFGQKTSEAISTTLKTDIASHVERLVKTQGVALTPYEQKKVVDDIYGEINKIAGENKQYQNHFGSLVKRAPLTEAGRLALITEARKYAKEILPSAALKIIREATNATVEKNQTITTKRVEQASHKEVQTSGGVPKPEGPKSFKEKAQETIKSKGRKLTEAEILAL